MSDERISLMDLVEKIRDISIEKLNEAENGIMMTACTWLYNAFALIGKLGLIKELERMINKWAEYLEKEGEEFYESIND